MVTQGTVMMLVAGILGVVICGVNLSFLQEIFLQTEGTAFGKVGNAGQKLDK